MSYLRTRKLKRIENFFFGKKTIILPKHKYFKCFKILTYKKKRLNTCKVHYSCKWKEITCIMSAFDFLRYQNDKTHEKHSTWWKRTTLTKLCILTVFYIIRYHNAKKDGTYPIWGKETTFPKTCLLRDYERVKQQNA